MKYMKMLGLAAVAAAALMAFVGASTASATTITNAAKQHYPIGTVIHAVNEGTVTLHPPIGSIECAASTVQGKTTTTGGPSESETVKGNIEILNFGSCNATVTTLKNGTLEIHTDKPGVNDGNGTLTSSGAEVTVLFAGFHCIFSTNNTDIGTVTGSKNLGGKTATFDIIANIPRTGGSSGIFCGSTAQWTGSYSITKPDYLDVD